VIRRLRFFVCILLFISGCAAQKNRTPGVPKTPSELIIVATTDFHSALDRAEGLASVIRSLKDRYDDQMLYLDAGDLFQGSLEGNLSKGEAVVKFMNLLPLDAAAIGNHELDYGPTVPGRVQVLPGEDGLGNLKVRVNEASYSWLSSNFIVDPPQSCDPDTESNCNALHHRTIFLPHSIKDRGGYRIGIIGATTATTTKITQPTYVKGTKFEEIDPVVIAEANYLRQKKKCDLVLLLAHEGPKRNVSGEYRKDTGIVPIFQKLPPGTLDAAVCGHSHIRVQEVVAGVPTLQAGLYGQVVGVMRIHGKQAHKKVSFDPWIEVPRSADQKDVTELLTPFREAAAEVKKVPIGNAAGPFMRNYVVENALGNMIADAILLGGKTAGDANFSLINAGGIRNDLPLGHLTYGDLFQVYPFENLLAIAELKGSELRRMIEIALSGQVGEASVSNLHITRLDVPPGVPGPWDRDLDGNGVKETWERNLILSIQDPGGKEIRDDQFYRMATIDYLTNGGDYQSEVFDHVPAERIHVYPEFPARDIVKDFIRTKSTIDPTIFYTEQTRRIIPIPPKDEPQKPAVLILPNRQNTIYGTASSATPSSSLDQD
jgi:5'-nucleotidase